MHVADIDYADFFLPVIRDPDEARRLVARVEKIPRDTSPARVILHQGARMLWLSDRMEEVAFGRPALQVLFLLIAAEAVAKLFFEFQGEGESRRYVRKFFNELCTPDDSEPLTRAFRRAGAFLPLADAVDLLYDVRCDVVHEGMYFGFGLPRQGEHLSVGNSWRGEAVTTLVRGDQLREVVLRGVVSTVRKLLQRA